MTTTGPVLVIEDHADTRHMVEEFLAFSASRALVPKMGLKG